MAYSSISKPSLHFNTKLYTGNGSTQSITGVGFQPDWVWFKNRSSSQNHRLFDAVRGAGKNLVSNNTGAEINAGTGTSGQLRTFDSDGFSVGSDGSVNNNGENIASWNWKANSSGSSNSDGSVTSTVSANTTAGFSIVKWTGTGATATVGHGLGVKPSMIIIKNTGATENWVVYHGSLGAEKNIKLNNTEAQQDTTGAFNDTEPTSSVFTVHTNTNVNQSGYVMIAYCFAEKTGYSKFGSYTGNASADGTFVYTGFKPAFLMVKRYDAAGDDWYIFDSARDTDNSVDKFLYPNADASEGTISPTLDFYSNGFKWRKASAFSPVNQSSATYIYMAFAEEPLVANVGNSIPATAR